MEGIMLPLVILLNNEITKTKQIKKQTPTETSMKFIQHIDKISQVLSISGILLIGYAELSRILNIYFFWESMSLGGIVILAALISLFYDFLMYKSQTHKYGIYILKLITIPLMILATSLTFYLNQKSEAFQEAEKFIYNSDKLKSELGDFKIGLIPYISEFKTHEIGKSVSGEANFGLILKGQNKFIDFEISVIKNPEDSLWMVQRK